jgi:hypothetical protein
MLNETRYGHSRMLEATTSTTKITMTQICESVVSKRIVARSSAAM